jgi:hypothetical protein
MSDTLLMLLEMIEEVLGEQSANAQDLATRYARYHPNIQELLKRVLGEDAFDVVYDKSGKGATLLHRVTYKLKAFTNRADLTEKIKERLELPDEALPIYDSSGNQIIGYKLKSGRSIVFSFVLKPQRGFNMAEQMENVIARASGNESAKFTNNDFLNKEVQRMRSAAEQIPGKPLTKLKNQKLPEDGLYKKYGAISGVPKTDLIGDKGENKYSVKKGGGAQFVSAQGPESAALWHIAAMKAATNSLNEPLVKQALTSVPADIKKQFKYENFKGIKDFSSNEKAEIYAAVGENLFKNILKKMGIDENIFKEEFAREGISGEMKFNGGAGSANKVLTWNDGPKKPAIEPIVDVDQYITNNKDKIQIRVSDRGGKRGGSIRGDILSKQAQNESIVIEVVDDKEQEAFEAVRQFIEKYDLTTQEISAIKDHLKGQLKEKALASAPAGRPPIDTDEMNADLAVLQKTYQNVLIRAFERLLKGDSSEEKTEEQYEQAVSLLTQQIDFAVLNKFKELKNYPVLFLDSLREYDGEDIDMTPFYEGLPVQFGDTEEPDEEIDTEG